MRRAIAMVAALATACTTGGAGTHPSAANTARPSPPASSLPPPIRTIGWQGQRGIPHSRVATGYTLPTTLRAAPACQLSQLDVVPLGGGAGGTFYATVSVRNTSTHPCAVRGRPLVELIDAHGRVFQSTGAAPTGMVATSIVLITNSWARVDLGGIASDTCGGDQTSTLAFSLASHTDQITLAFPVGSPPNPRDCPGRTLDTQPHPGQLQHGAFQRIAAPGDDRFILTTALNVTLSVPSRAPVGTTLTYQAVFTNRGNNGGGIDDMTCPLFSQQLAAAPEQGGDYLLSCNPPVLIDAGQSVAFQMRLSIPAGTPVGPSRLTWQLLEPFEPPINTTIEITRD